MSRIRGRLRRSALGALRRPGAVDDVTRRLGSLDDRTIAALLRPATQQLAQRTPRVGVIGAVAGPDVTDVSQALQQVAPKATVEVLDPALGGSELHVRLAATGPYDVLVDAAVDEAESVRAARARVVLMHLRRDGVLLVADAGRHHGDPTTAPGEKAQSFPDLFRDAFDVALTPKETRLVVASDHQRGWARAVGEVTVSETGPLAVTNALPALPIIREREVGRLLELRPDRGRVVLERPGSLVVNPQPIRQSPTDHPWELQTRFEAPPMQLREYRDVTCWPGQVVTQQHLLLPETYRHLARQRLRHKFVEGVSPRFGRVKATEAPEHLPGTYFHLDSEFRGHFGHAMTEQISRLWAWDEVKEQAPDARALLLSNRHRTTVADWEYRLYEAAGVAREDLVLADGPVRVDRLFAATPMFSQPQFVHAGIVDVYRRIGDDLAAEAPDRAYPERIFCSRRMSKRACTNADQVEEFFSELGFTVVYPEEYSLGEQVQMFRSARDVAGFGGSAMFTMAFTTSPKRAFLVSSENYWAQNETVIAAVQGHQANVAWCRPEKTKAAGFQGKELLHSPFTFDVDREGSFLRDAFHDTSKPPVGGVR